MNIAVIPARGGSKRIPRKNIKFFHGKPIIFYSIDAALKSNLFKRVIVSTDDEEIAEISISLGAEVPFIRPKNLSDDFTGTHDVMRHAVKYLTKENQNIKYFCCIYPTAPLIEINDLKDGFSEIKKDKYLSVFGATKFGFPIERSFKIDPIKGLSLLFPRKFFLRSQDITETYHDAGQFYWCSKKAWLSKSLSLNNKCFPIIMPNWRVQDIDTPEDWKRAELIYNSIKN